MERIKYIYSWFMGGSVTREFIITLPNREDCRVTITMERPRLFWVAVILLMIVFQIMLIMLG